MKSQRLLSYLVLTVLMLLPTWMVGQNGPRVMRVLQAESVSIERNGERISPIARGYELAVGDVVRTGVGAKVFLNFPNGDSAVIGEETVVAIESYTYLEATDTLRTRLRMNEGEIIADLENLKKSSNNPQFDVATKVGVAGIRGTQFVIRVRQDPLTGKITASFGVSRGDVFVELTGSAALAAQAALNDVTAGDELIIEGDFDPETGEVTSVDSVNSVPLTPQTRQAVEQAVNEIMQARSEEGDSGEGSGGSEGSDDSDENEGEGDDSEGEGNQRNNEERRDIRRILDDLIPPPDEDPSPITGLERTE